MADRDAIANGLKLLEQAPLGQLVQSIGMAIAEAQYNMDRFAIRTLELLDDREVTASSCPTRAPSARCWSWDSLPAFTISAKPRSRPRLRSAP